MFGHDVCPRSLSPMAGFRDGAHNFRVRPSAGIVCHLLEVGFRHIADSQIPGSGHSNHLLCCFNAWHQRRGVAASDCMPLL